MPPSSFRLWPGRNWSRYDGPDLAPQQVIVFQSSREDWAQVFRSSSSVIAKNLRDVVAVEAARALLIANGNREVVHRR